MITKTIASLIGMVYAAGGSGYDYKTNGKDWPNLTNIAKNECGGSNQSPIDLTYDMESSDELDTRDDAFNIFGSNEKQQTVIWNGFTSQVNMKTGNGGFWSQFAWNDIGSSRSYSAVQYHWHAQSEHTIEGQRFDLELHIVHAPNKPYKVTNNNGFKYAVLGIIFDTENHNADLNDNQEKLIDAMFDSMAWDNAANKVVVPETKVGEFLQQVNTDRRWTYQGSLTTPPCSTKLYWNVFSTVYPIKQRHLDQFLKLQERTAGLRESGNWRVIQETTDKHSTNM